MSMAILKHKISETAYQDYDLGDASVSVGRSNTCDIAVDDTSMSRLHFRIENRGGQYFVVDNNSSNGVFLNRRKVAESPLKNGDAIIAGRVEFYFSQKVMAEGHDRTQPIEMDGQPEIAQTVRMSPGGAPPFPPVDETAELPGAPAPPPMADASAPVAPPAPPTPPTPQVDHAPPPVVPNAPATPPAPPMAVPTPPPAPQAIPTPQAPPPYAAPPSGAHTRAKPVTRLLACLIDVGVFLVLNIPGILLRFLGLDLLALPFSLIAAIAGLVYIPLAWIKYGKTVGKHVMKIRVIESANPGPVLTPKVAILRFVGLIAAGLPCGLGHLYIFFNEEGHGIQDKVAGTEVIEE